MNGLRIDLPQSAFFSTVSETVGLYVEYLFKRLHIPLNYDTQLQKLKIVT